MRSNYKRIGDFIQQVKVKNTDGACEQLLGINIDKFFMPSVANVVGTDLTKYKVVQHNQFACNRMHVGRDYRIPIALSRSSEPFIVSPAYTVFEVVDTSELHQEYLMMWFSRGEFDREAWFHTDADVRGGLPWDLFCDIELPIPSVEKQRKIVKEYNTIVNRIKLNEAINQKLEETCQGVFNSCFQPSGEREMDLVRLGDLIEIKGGFSYHSSGLGKGNAYLLGMGCISFSSRFLENGMRQYSNVYPEKHLVKPGDIVIATRQQSENMPILGYPAMIPPDLKDNELIAAANLYRVEYKSDLSNVILYQLLRSSDYLEHIRLNTKGTTVGMITKDAVEDFYFRMPSTELITKLHKDLSSIVNLIFVKREEIKKLIEMRDLLLSKMTKTEILQTEQAI